MLHHRVLLVSLVILTALAASAAASIPTTSYSAAAPPSPVAASPTAVAWLTFDGDPARSGVNEDEHRIAPNNVSHLSITWSRALPGPVDSSPVFQNGRLFLTLMNGSTVAVDARSGRLLWQARTRGPRFTTASPTIDPTGAWVYAYGLDGFVHRYATTTGQEEKDHGWPIQVTTMPNDEKGSSALNLANGRLYVTTSGYPSDGGHYEGHLVTIDLASGSATVFNTLCNNVRAVLVAMAGTANYCTANESGVWARSGAVVDPTTGRVFIATGNGPWDGMWNWGDSVLALSADGRTLLDSYTPTDQLSLNSNDGDFGSSAPALLPTQPSSTTPILAVQGSKDGKLRLLNRRDLSGRGRPRQLGGELQIMDSPKGCEVRTAPAVWSAPDGTPWVFVADDCALAGLTLQTNARGQSRLVEHWLDSPGGSSPLLANGILYVARGQSVQALEPQSGRVLWSSSQLGASGSLAPIHWQSPIVVDGQVYIADGAGKLVAFGLPSGAGS